MALAVYQAASKLQSPPVYPTDADSEAANLQQRLDGVTEELRLTRLELQITREETRRAFLALNERLDRLLSGSEGQSDHRSDTVPESLDGEQEGSPTTPTLHIEPLSMKGIIGPTVPVLESPTRLDPKSVLEAEKTLICGIEGISQTAHSEAVAAEAPPQRWAPTSVGRNKAAPNESSLEFVERKVKVLLNKLASENFDSISDQIVHWVNKSENEKNGRVLSLIIMLVFEKATDESHWAEMYARLCKRMMERISPAVRDDSVRNQAGEPIIGGQLFLKLLREGSQAGGNTSREPELGSDEYYTRVKDKRQGIGLVRFIGELFKLQMLTERIVHGCIKMLLPSENGLPNLTEAEIESLCQLLTTVGETLDVPKCKVYMDGYFQRLRMVADNEHISSRIRYMVLLDLSI
ncbi:hypothetical protein FRC01_009364 [Tulasnella sp. 417]|nr:hypothetical protein FRC01_009364 [Tulasnella sp. 417]